MSFARVTQDTNKDRDKFMKGSQVERNIYVAGMEAFALAQVDIAERLVGIPRAHSLKAKIIQDEIFKAALAVMEKGFPYQDNVAVSATKSVIIGGLLIQRLIDGEAVKVNMDVLGRCADAKLKDLDLLMDTIDISRENGVNNIDDIGKVVTLRDRFVRAMVGSLYMKSLQTDHDKAVQREEFLSLSGQMKDVELAIIGWIPPEYLVPSGRGY